MTTTTHYLEQLRLDELTLTVPLTADREDTRTIEVFARIATRPGGESLPYLFYLQGGPGYEAWRPSLSPLEPSWLNVALERYRVVFVDERGTGRSTPVGEDILSTGSAAEVAEYLSHMRADGIVRDCEALRQELGVEKINLLGQSFGGFTTVHYLSVAPEHIDQAFLTGGLTAVRRSADDVYSLTWEKMREHSEEYYRRFPAHRDRVRELVELAGSGSIELPTGEIVSPSRLRSLGHLLGSDNGWRELYYLLEKDPASTAFRYDLAAAMPFDGRNPLYYVLHESSYADGVVTNWSAERTQPEAFRTDTSLLYGEHVWAEWADTVPAFQPWKDVVEKLATWEWPQLYFPEALRESGARGAAAVYVNDAYVPLEFSLETGALLPGIHRYVTSTHEHSGLRSSNGAVLRTLFELADGTRLR
ncbi:alpha/beta fold hydrolase [Actinotignum sp. GS-2025b]|uniref:alpha/beta fold hydrolase n=1 Tax=unclassified Actinotignum TaxID=2632702 RepID=UPI003F473BA4